MAAKGATGLNALPVVSGSEVVKAFGKFGWTKPQGRPGKGDHIIITKTGSRYTLSVPNHKQVKKTVLKRLLDRAGITIDEFNDARKRRKGA